MFTARELEVLEHIGMGESNEKIALELFIGLQTVKTHSVVIYRKLEVPPWANKRAWTAVYAAEILRKEGSK